MNTALNTEHSSSLNYQIHLSAELGEENGRDRGLLHPLQAAQHQQDQSSVEAAAQTEWPVNMTYWDADTIENFDIF